MNFRVTTEYHSRRTCVLTTASGRCRISSLARACFAGPSLSNAYTRTLVSMKSATVQLVAGPLPAALPGAIRRSFGDREHPRHPLLGVPGIRVATQRLGKE